MIALKFAGAMLQSATDGNASVLFGGVMALGEDPSGGVWIMADGLRQVKGLTVGPKVLDNPYGYCHLVSDGRILWVVSNGGATPVLADGTSPNGWKYGTGVNVEVSHRSLLPVPEDNRAFRERGKFVVFDKTRREIVFLDANGRRGESLAEGPSMGLPSEVEEMAFLPETGELVAVTGHPDSRTYRFSADGRRHDVAGWPIFRGGGTIGSTNGELWYRGGDRAFRVEAVYNASEETVSVLAPGNAERGYVRTKDGLEYLGSYQGLYVRGRGEPRFRRIGGLPGPLDALTTDGRKIYLYERGQRLRSIWLDDAPDATYENADELRNQFGWTESVVALSPFCGELFALAPQSGLNYCVYSGRGLGQGRKWQPWTLPDSVRAPFDALVADEPTREVFLTANGVTYAGRVLSGQRRRLDVRPVAGIPDGVRHLSRRRGSDVVHYATERAVGAFSTSGGTVVWLVRTEQSVHGLASLGKVAVFATENGIFFAGKGKAIPVADGSYGSYGLVAAAYPWIVIEDRQGRRLLRFRVVDE